MTATFNVNNVSFLLSVLWVAVSVIVFMGGWYFQSSIVELRTDLMEKNKEISELNEKLNKLMQPEKSQQKVSKPGQCTVYEAFQVQKMHVGPTIHVYNKPISLLPVRMSWPQYN